MMDTIIDNPCFIQNSVWYYAKLFSSDIFFILIFHISISHSISGLIFCFQICNWQITRGERAERRMESVRGYSESGGGAVPAKHGDQPQTSRGLVESNFLTELFKLLERKRLKLLYLFHWIPTKTLYGGKSSTASRTYIVTKRSKLILPHTIWIKRSLTPNPSRCQFFFSPIYSQ